MRNPIVTHFGMMLVRDLNPLLAISVFGLLLIAPLNSSFAREPQENESEVNRDSAANILPETLMDYPHLTQYLHSEKDNHLYFGMGLTPLQIMQSKAGISASFFQLHWITKRFDFEILSASYGRSITGDPLSKVSAFTFRSVPKLKLIEGLSIGPLLGVEFVSFSEVLARLVKGTQGTPYESWSTRGWIYGGTVSQTFRFGRSYHIKLNQSVYKQTYSTEGTSNEWKYFFADESLRENSAPISPGMVFLFEFSILY